MKTFVQRLFKDQSGIAATEFALISPFLILLTVGMIDFGMYINENMKVENLARNATEYVVKGGDEANITADVITSSGLLTEDELEDTTTTSEMTCECSDGSTVACNTECSDGGYRRRYFSYSIERAYSPIFPYPGIPETFPLRGHARMQVE
ncbi:MAG: pilus assembly protein [Proteobacteria bacterium]|nr:pilus assembly protein [Pseudomonadota bacterium]